MLIWNKPSGQPPRSLQSPNSLRGQIWLQIWNQWPQLPTYPYAFCLYSMNTWHPPRSLQPQNSLRGQDLMFTCIWMLQLKLFCYYVSSPISCNQPLFGLVLMTFLCSAHLCSCSVVQLLIGTSTTMSTTTFPRPNAAPCNFALLGHSSTRELSALWFTSDDCLVVLTNSGFWCGFSHVITPKT